jgi:hypothetical protein
LTSWNEEHIKQWLEGVGIHETIVKNIWPCNGNQIEELKSLYRTAPDFVLKSISKSDVEKEIPLMKDITKFITELQKVGCKQRLFEKRMF